MTFPISRLALVLAATVAVQSARAGIGADLSWTTYEAEDMKTSGAVMGPKYAPFLVEMESSKQKCVKLAAQGQYVEFTADAAANAMVVRYSLPDSTNGGGVNSTLSLYVNGKLVKNLSITSHLSWLYGNYPFMNSPRDAKPRNFYNEAQVKGLTIAKGDVVRLQKTFADAPATILDLVDLENVAAPLAAPANSLSIVDFGADVSGQVDATEAVRACVAEAVKTGKTVWAPAGTYKLAGDIQLTSGVTIQGAGMWHTTFVGDAQLYDQADKRVRFRMTGSNIHLADFGLFGQLNYRNDNEPNDGVVGAKCDNSSISRLWIEHTKVGIWIYNGTKLNVEGCRFRNTLADGINLCVDTRDSVVQNCTARGTGDDCFAIWPAASDQGFTQAGPDPGHNVFRNCTGQLPFLANGGAIYGGTDNRMENCLFTDISPGCGILISSTFPTSDDTLKIDNNFNGTTLVQDCELIRCGGYDHSWAWRAAFQVCMDRKSISGLTVRNVNIKDSLSDGFSVVGPGSKKGQGTLSNSKLENVNIPNFGIGATSRHGLWIRDDSVGSLTVINSQIAETKNATTNFSIVTQ